jgi:hypothetical protein
MGTPGFKRFRPASINVARDIPQRSSAEDPLAITEGPFLVGARRFHL